eukprot:953256-Pelagomonas_calceolata.AAC.2
MAACPRTSSVPVCQQALSQWLPVQGVHANLKTSKKPGQTTATIYSLVGALNKIPVAIFGLVIFREPTNPKNLASIILGLLAGVMFVRAKQQPQRATAMK